jgi:hypothetical protein
MKRILCVLLLLFCSPVWAQSEKEPLVYASVPLPYSKFTPKVAPCSYEKESTMGVCGWTTYPEQTMVSVTVRSNTQWRNVYQIDMYQEVVCNNGVCTDAFQQPQGSLPTLVGISYWQIPIGYYLTESPNGFIAVKHGNGPLAKHYPIRDVYVKDTKRLDGEHVPLEKTAHLYQVACQEQSGQCLYLGRVLPVTELANWIPNVLTETCDQYLCYLNSDRQQVVGLNPKREYAGALVQR